MSFTDPAGSGDDLSWDQFPNAPEYADHNAVIDAANASASTYGPAATPSVPGSDRTSDYASFMSAPVSGSDWDMSFGPPPDAPRQSDATPSFSFGDFGGDPFAGLAAGTTSDSSTGSVLSRPSTAVKDDASLGDDGTSQGLAFGWRATQTPGGDTTLQPVADSAPGQSYAQPITIADRAPPNKDLADPRLNASKNPYGMIVVPGTGAVLAPGVDANLRPAWVPATPDQVQKVRDWVLHPNDMQSPPSYADFPALTPAQNSSHGRVLEVPNSVDREFIRVQGEGNQRLEGYTLPGFPNSGVTVASGFDLGHHNVNDLKRLGLSDSDIETLKPLLLLKGDAAERARASYPNGFRISQDLADRLDAASMPEAIRNVSRAYDAENPPVRFADLPAPMQTVLADIQFQRQGGFRQMQGGAV